MVLARHLGCVWVRDSALHGPDGTRRTKTSPQPLPRPRRLKGRSPDLTHMTAPGHARADWVPPDDPSAPHPRHASQLCAALWPWTRRTVVWPAGLDALMRVARSACIHPMGRLYRFPAAWSRPCMNTHLPAIRRAPVGQSGNFLATQASLTQPYDHTSSYTVTHSLWPGVQAGGQVVICSRRPGPGTLQRARCTQTHLAQASAPIGGDCWQYEPCWARAGAAAQVRMMPVSAASGRRRRTGDSLDIAGVSRSGATRLRPRISQAAAAILVVWSALRPPARGVRPKSRSRAASADAVLGPLGGSWSRPGSGPGAMPL